MQRITQPLREMGLISEKIKEITGATRLAEEFTQVRDALALGEIQKLSVVPDLRAAAQGVSLPQTLASLAMAVPLNDVLKQFTPAQRAWIEARATEFIKEAVTLRDLPLARKKSDK